MMSTNIKLMSLMAVAFVAAAALPNPEEQPNDKPAELPPFDFADPLLIVVYVFLGLWILGTLLMQCWKCLATRASKREQIVPRRQYREVSRQHAEGRGQDREESSQHAEGNTASHNEAPRAGNSRARIWRSLSRHNNGTPDNARDTNETEQIELGVTKAATNQNGAPSRPM